MGRTLCCGDATCHSLAMNGSALLGSALPMVELTMSIMVVRRTAAFFRPDQLHGFPASWSSQETTVSSSSLAPRGRDIDELLIAWSEVVPSAAAAFQLGAGMSGAPAFEASMLRQTGQPWHCQ